MEPTCRSRAPAADRMPPHHPRPAPPGSRGDRRHGALPALSAQAALDGYEARSGTTLDPGQRHLVTTFASDGRLLLAGTGKPPRCAPSPTRAARQGARRAGRPGPRPVPPTLLLPGGRRRGCRGHGGPDPSGTACRTVPEAQPLWMTNSKGARSARASSCLRLRVPRIGVATQSPGAACRRRPGCAQGPALVSRSRCQPRGAQPWS